ncbi:uncharacterized protein SOCE26_035620 [Sorangium cellulosum]|uniref:Polymerase nucleotidyl transferase domain-containing protein n=1 Tax=Sorangium cellulosum TaxID=56 RepID=A0A2L0ES72_SORCE|nr:nucleotidyltransferase domain-containing protein [Sorangium cellulosum]AUX42135.1 uncharacterized protein SOCE26_035620 [Sorangium cellulosum]
MSTAASMPVPSPLPDIAPLVAELRGLEPRARAFAVFGSHARGDAGPCSDLDLRVITAGEPVERDRVRFLGGVDGPLLHVSIGSRSLRELVARAESPSGWPWMAGFCASARAIDDPQDLLGVLRRVVESHRPDRITTAAGAHYDLESLLEYLAKCKNARAAGRDLELLAAALHLAEHAMALLVPLNEVSAVGGEDEHRAAVLAFAVAPPGYREDVVLCAGWSASARPPAAVFAAAMRLAEGTARLLMSRADALPLRGALADYLRDGTVLRYILGTQ